jgi:hypothetical protein
MSIPYDQFSTLEQQQRMTRLFEQIRQSSYARDEVQQQPRPQPKQTGK